MKEINFIAIILLLVSIKIKKKIRYLKWSNISKSLINILIMQLSLSIMAIKDVTPLEITTAKLVLTMPATLIPESKSNFSKRVNGMEVTFFK